VFLYLLSCSQFPINKLTELLRQDLAAAGFTEALTFALVRGRGGGHGDSRVVGRRGGGGGNGLSHFFINEESEFLSRKTQPMNMSPPPSPSPFSSSSPPLPLSLPVVF